MTATVIVVGSINVDLTTYVQKLPSPGETVIGGRFVRSHGGKGANQAVAAARLGADVKLVGMVGDDDLGREARSVLEAEGVDLSCVRVVEEHTGVAQILVDASAENLIAVASGANDEVTPAFVRSSLKSIDAEDAVVLSVLEVPGDAVYAAGRASLERGWRFVLNPAPARHLSTDLLRLCHVLTPNQHEVGGLGYASPQELLAAGARSVVVTRGAEGATVHRPGAPTHTQTAFPCEVVDTTGAGDAFSGGLAWALAEGRSLEDAVAVGAAAGALTTQRAGARTSPSREEALSLLEGAPAPRSGS